MGAEYPRGAGGLRYQVIVAQARYVTVRIIPSSI
jgi:hypothetical protein